MPEHELKDLLKRRESAPDVSLVDRLIKERFGAQRAVMFSYMSGFSRLSHRQGIEHFLGPICQIRDLCIPVVQARGRLVKAEAVNLFGTFDDPVEALLAARELQRVT
ncbi:MAG: hypothetical protein ACI9MC_003600 [Kiritimatiellia bacterium]|jgi:hypothetical protein